MKALLFLVVAAGLAVRVGNGPWQTPGPFETPHGTWQTPGQIQVPRGIQAVSSHSTACTQTITVAADALFEFDRYALSDQAQQTLSVFGPLIKKRAAGHSAVVNGYTDAIGSDAYNQTLSEERATTVRDWLGAHGDLSASTPIKGYGKLDPVAPNTNPDGSDNPQGRQKNRRVEVAIATCG